MDSFIARQDTLDIWVLLLAITAVAIWAGSTRYGKLLGGAVIAIIIGILLGNLRFLPVQASAYLAVDAYFLPIAIPLLLFHADLRKIIRESGPTLLAFLIGVAGTVLGVILADWAIQLPAYQGGFAGTFAATYIGGGMNFAAVSTASGIPPGDYLAAATAADNIMTILFLFVLGAMPAIAFFKNTFPGERDLGAAEEIEDSKKPLWICMIETAFALAVAYLFVWAGTQLQESLRWEGVGLMATTLLAVLFATFVRPLASRTGNAFDLGMVLMIVFFTSLGARADVVGTIGIAPVMFGYVAIVIAVHAVFLFGLGKLCKLTLPELITASNACILGAATAGGLAAAKGWKSLVTPGILVGTLGYAIANFIGIGLADWLS